MHWVRAHHTGMASPMDKGVVNPLMLVWISDWIGEVIVQ